jgi:hypothetical protein
MSGRSHVKIPNMFRQLSQLRYFALIKISSHKNCASLRSHLNKTTQMKRSLLDFLLDPFIEFNLIGASPIQKYQVIPKFLKDNTRMRSRHRPVLQD